MSGWIKTEKLWYEYAYKRICKFWIQRESCRDCLFDNLCTPEDKAQDKNKWTSKNKNSYDVA